MHTTHSSARRRVIAMAASALLLATGLATAATPAWADDGIANFDVAGKVAADGTLSLSTTITFNGDAPGQFVQRLDSTAPGDDYTYYQYAITNVTATAGGADLAPVVSTDGDFVVITVNTASIGATPLEIGYDVAGAAMDGGVSSGGTALTTVNWPVVQGLSLAVEATSGSISVLGMIRSVDCKSGVVTGLEPCQLFGGGTYDAPAPFFQDASIGVGQVVQFSFIVPSSSVAVNQQVMAQWTLDRAFSVALLPLLLALGVLIVGALGLLVLYRLRGRDVASSKDPTRVASFEPSGKGTVTFEVHDEIRPGHVGTVIDEHVDPIDITATILDLAVRGHMRIVQLPGDGLHAPIDWTFERLASDEPLRPYELTLLDEIAPVGGPAAIVSHIGEPVEHVIGQVQNQLYEDVVDRGWFARRPNQTRHLFTVLGWVGLCVAIAALVLLVAMTGFGLLGLVLVVLGAGLLSLAQTMPRRTGAGVDLQHGLHALSMVLQTQPTDQIPKKTAYDEISRILPYAVVLGGRARWVQALADADADPGVPDPDDLNWYHAPVDWNLEDLPACLDGFIAHMSGRLVGRD